MYSRADDAETIEMDVLWKVPETDYSCPTVAVYNLQIQYGNVWREYYISGAFS